MTGNGEEGGRLLRGGRLRVCVHVCADELSMINVQRTSDLRYTLFVNYIVDVSEHFAGLSIYGYGIIDISSGIAKGYRNEYCT